MDLYPVTGREHFAGRQDEEVIAALAQGGAKIVQLRDKNLTDREYYRLSLLYRRETDKHGLLFIVNDRPDIALAVRADGIHLGRSDLPVSVARTILGPDAIIGASSNTPATAKELEKSGATYINIGPLFPTPTKPDAKNIGLKPLRIAIENAGIPISTMGGITADNIDEVLSTGVKHVGVVTAVFAGADITKAVSFFVKRIVSAR